MAGLVPFNRKNRELMAGGFEDFYNLLDDFFTPRSLERATFKMDLHETEKEFVIEADLPGVQKDQVGLNLEEGKLTIAVNREESVEDAQKNYLHKERRVSSMSRSIFLKDANPAEVKAKLENGVLTVSIPKMEKQISARKIEID